MDNGTVKMEERLLPPEAVKAWRAGLGADAPVAVVAGTFDILQPGNLCAIRRAAATGWPVVVVVEPDDAVRAHALPGRPQYPLEVRAEMAACLRDVAVVTAVGPAAAEGFFEQLRPFAWVTARGARHREAYGAVLGAKAASVLEIDPLPGCFTEEITEAMREERTPIRLPSGLWAVPPADVEPRPGRVTVNGCFDILHAGHLRLLAAARAMGSSLTVLINDDRSVARYKGPTRPVFPEVFRAGALKALSMVDDVVLFSEDEPLNTLARLRPDVHVKGGSFEPERVRHERALVEGWGGRLVPTPLVEGYSSTGYIRQALASVAG
jgi:rfaE bifunctional protein nucleotidyltransferase chain/domain